MILDWIGIVVAGVIIVGLLVWVLIYGSGE